jgi:hypothetical protein
MKHVRLPAYDATDLDDLSYTNGELVNDTTNALVRYMDGETPGGFKLATQDYVQTNAITSANLAANLTTALVDYARRTELSSYATTTALSSAISAIPIYSLPIATNSVLGGVKVDGTSITINPTTGVISGSNQYSLPIATASVLGGVKPDGTTITINPSTGVISGANTYVLPTATTSIKGGVKPDGVTILVDANGVISGANQYVLPAATTTVRGGVIIPAVGTSGINNTSGTIGLATATTTQLGGVIIPAVANSGLTNTSGSIRLATATTNQLGGVKVDGVTITINGSGVIAANITGAIVFQGGWSAATNTPTLSNASSAYNTNGFEFVCTAAGTVNFGAGNVSFAVGDNVIYDGVKWVKIPIGSSAGTTSNTLTFDNSGTGVVSGSTFNGSAIVTMSYNTIGASPLAGSSSITTLGTIGTGTWNGDIIDSTYGGTGVNNGGRTLTITGANRTLDQSVASGAAPTFLGTNFSGTASNLAVGSASSAGSATVAGKSNSLAGGLAFQMPYQTALDTTGFVAAPADNTYLRYTTAGGIAWGAVALATSATTATNIAGGAVRQIVVQTGVGTTGFVVAPTTASTYLQWNGSAYVFSTVTGATGGTVTSVGGTGTVNGLTLTGTVTGSGSLTLGGTLSLASPPAIGGTAPAAGAFTTLSANNRITASFQAATTDGGGTIYLSNGTNNRIDFASGGVAAPAFTTRSAGTKIVLWPGVAAAAVDYAIGIEGSTYWESVPNASSQFKWYAGQTNIASLSGTGAMSALTFTSTQATGTAPFTVTSTTNVANLNASSVNGVTADKVYLQAITTLAVTNNGITAYRFDQYGTSDDPTIYAISGTTIAFDLNVSGHPFLIRTNLGVNYDVGLVHVSTTGTVLTGSSAQGQTSGTLYWKIPQTTVGAYQYACSVHLAMVGVITIKNIASMA